MQLYFVFIFLFLGLIVIGGVLYFGKKKSSVQLRSSSDSANGQPELVIAPNYLHKLERDIQSALEGAVRSAGAGMREELTGLLKEVSQQNTRLVAGVKDFENTFQQSLQAEVANLQKQFSEDARVALDKLHAQNQELVVSVERVEEEAKKQFRENLLASTSEVGEGLTRTVQELRKEMITMVEGAIKRELQAFHEIVLEAQKSTVQSLAKVYEDVGKKKEALEKQVVDEVAQTQKQLLERFEKKFNTTILQFLSENLPDALDLTNQEKYIVKMLEDNKEKLIKELHEEV